MRTEGLQVAVRLSPDQLRERVGLARDLEVALRVVDELEEPPGRRAALVELAGRVQVARAVSERGRDAVRTGKEIL